MEDQTDLKDLADRLNLIASLYQFRGLDQRLYGTLTVSQSYTLRTLYFNGARSMSELAAGLKVRLSTITGIVDQLEGKGLVVRIAHPEDRRSLQVELTPKGRKLYRVAHEAFLSHIGPLFAGRPRAERKELLAFLAEVAEAIRGWQRNPVKKATNHGKSKS